MSRSLRPILPVLLAALVLVLALPGAAVAKGGAATRLATKACVQEKKEIGRNAFAKRYGERNAMRACVRRKRADARRAIAAANAECQAELDDFGPEDFFEDFDSFEECVLDYAEDDLLTDPVPIGGDDEDDDDLL